MSQFNKRVMVTTVCSPGFLVLETLLLSIVESLEQYKEHGVE